MNVDRMVIHVCVVVLVALSSCGQAVAGGDGQGGPSDDDDDGELAVTNVLPANGASDVPARANLCALATDQEIGNLTLTFYGRDLSTGPAEDFALIALPDTQAYAQSYPAIFNAQMQWIVEQREALDIPFVTHLGDVVDIGLSEFEWQIADAAFSLLEDPATTGLPDGIPYGIAVGNHDQTQRSHGTINSPGWTTEHFNQHFGPERFQDRAYFGGNLGDNNDNSYQLFSAGGMDFIALHLEFERVTILDLELREQVLDWADEVLETHSDRRAIVSSHHLLNWDDASWTDQGQAIYDRLKHNPNLFLMLCAHLAGEPRRTDTFQGNTVHTLMSDYQFYENGGDGYLRIYTFSPADDEIRATTYSPWLDEFRVNPQDQFTVGYEMNGGRPFDVVGSVENVPNGDTVCVEWTGRQDGRVYEWYVQAANATKTGRGAAWSFSGGGSCLTLEDCEDADPCTSVACQHEVCSQTPLQDCCDEDSDCVDGNPCTDDVCEASVCSNAPNTHACSDGSACTGDDRCEGGVCAGTADSCDDGNACTLDTCFEEACLHEYYPTSGCCATGGECRDDGPCTVDICDAGGNCVNTPDAACCTASAQCDDDSACSVESCSPTNTAAFRVNGNEHISMRPKGFWPFYEEAAAETFTLELWFKWDGGGTVAYTSEQDTGVPAYPLVTRGHDDPRSGSFTSRDVNYFLGIRQDSHVLIADFEEHETGSNPGLNHPVAGSTPIGVAEWHHAAASYDGNCWQLYLDGQPETDGTDCPGQPPAFEAVSGLNIASAQNWEGWVSGHFSGLLDEVRVWNRALSPAEIQANMNSQIETHPDLIGRWGLDEIADLFVFDSTGNGLTGVTVGGTLETVDVLPLGGNVCSYVSLAPAAVAELTLALTPDSVELSWPQQGPGTSYDVIRGAFEDLFTGGSSPPAQCLADEIAVPVWIDELAPGDFFYLVRGVSECGPGPYGTGTSGQPRTPQNACP